MVTKTKKNLLIYCPTEFLTDYFVFIAEKIHSANLCKVTLASPFTLKDTDCETKNIPQHKLSSEPHGIVWTTSDQLKYVNPAAVRIASNHHAGYGESFFVPNTNVTKYADYLFCAMYKPGNVSRDIFQNLLVTPEQRELTIIPVGYPKLDICIQACQENENHDAVMITMASEADIPFNVEPVLREAIDTILTETSYKVFLRPKPIDINAGYVKTLEKEFYQSGRFEVNKTSYIPVLSRAKHMLFFGRHDVTTAYTCAYSSGRPVIFIDINKQEPIQERDIGVTINSPHSLKLAMEAVDSSESKQRLMISRLKDVDYPCQSTKRIIETVSWILHDKTLDFSNYHPFSIGPKSEFNQQNVLALNDAINLSESISKNHANSYAIENYLYHFIENSNDSEQFDLVLDCLIKLSSHLKTINFINVWTRLLNLSKQRLVNLNTDKLAKVASLASKGFFDLPSPSEHLATRAFRCFNLCNDEKSCEKLIGRLITTNERQTFAVILPYLRLHHFEQYLDLLEKYVETSGYWDPEKLTQLTKSSYSLFGLGDSSVQLVDYIRNKGLPLPCKIYGHKPNVESINGCPVTDVNEYCENELLAIVSPTAHDIIVSKLEDMKAKRFRFSKIVR